jgi:hypothetical protein
MTSGMSTGASKVAATQKKGRKRGSGADNSRPAATLVVLCGRLRAMPVTSAAQKTRQLAEAAETVVPSQTGWDVPAAREEMLLTSGMSAGASKDMATQEGSQRPQSREPHYSRDADGGTECRRQELRTGLSHRVRFTGPCPAEWPDKLSGGPQVPPEGSRDPRPGREPSPPWTASPRRSQRKVTRRRSGNGQPQQQQRAARKQQAAAGRCEREQIGQVATAAHGELPVNGYQVRRACPKVHELYSNTLGIQKQLSRALGGSDNVPTRLRTIAERYSPKVGGTREQPFE